MRAQVALTTLSIIVGCGTSAGENPTATGGAPNSGGQQQSSSGTANAGTNTVPGTSGSTAVGGQVGVGGNATAGAMTSAGQPATAGAAGGGGAATTAGSGGGGGSSGGSGGGSGSATGGSGGGSSGSGGGSSGAVKSPGCDKARALMDGNQTITSGGQSRQWYVKAPKNYDQSHAYRTIFMYHWNYGSINAIVNPPDADKNTDRPFYGIEDLSADSTIFVVPNGLENGWANTGGRDSTFTDDMYKAVTNGLCIDTSRVFTTGFSYGGAISLKLACTKPDKFRAAVVYDTGTFLSGFNQSECKTPIAFFESHGLDDHTFDYAEGLNVLGIFTKLNGCTAQTPPMAADNAHTCVSFDGCSAGHPVRFCNFGKGENNPKAGGPGGHYPSPKDPGQTTSWVPAEAWKFISAF